MLDLDLRVLRFFRLQTRDMVLLLHKLALEEFSAHAIAIS